MGQMPLKAQPWVLDFEAVKDLMYITYYSHVNFVDGNRLFGNFNRLVVPGEGNKNFRYIARINEQGQLVADANIAEFSGINSTIISHAVNNNVRYLGVYQADSVDTPDNFASNIYIHNAGTNTFAPIALPVFNHGVRLFRLTDRYFFLYGEFTQARSNRTGGPNNLIQLAGGAGLWDLQNITIPTAMPTLPGETPGLGGAYVSHSEAAGTLFIATDKGFRVLREGFTTWQNSNYPAIPAGGLFTRFCVFSQNEVYGVWRRTADSLVRLQKLSQGAWSIIGDLTNQASAARVQVNSIERLDEWLVITHNGTHLGTTPVNPVFAYNTLTGAIQNFQPPPLRGSTTLETSFTKVINGNLYFFTVNEGLIFYPQEVYAIKFTAENALEYEFIGNGNWTNPANWKKGFIPPSPFPSGKYIYINPQGDGESVLDKNHVMQPGSHLIIRDNKRFRIPGNLNMQ